jgi:hypothetical protein
MQAGNTCNASGVCVPTCAAGWDNCDNEPWDGCEADITGGNFCGACGVTCGGLTASCVLSGSTRKCQATITQLGTPVSDGIQGPTLNLTHNLTAGPGQNRMVIVAVASRATNGGVTQAKPETVTYAGVGMANDPSLVFDGGVPATDGQAHIFYYYLGDASLPATAGNKTVVIDGSSGASAPTVVTAVAVAFTGVRQTSPLTVPVGGIFANCMTIQPSNAVAVATTGSVIFSVSAAQYSGVASPTGSLALLMDNETSPAGMTDSPMRALAGIRGIAAQLTSSGSPYTVGWNYAWCSQSVHFAVVIHPAQAP